MRLFGLVALTMIAFAANSVLNRLALSGGAIGPAAFAAVRLGSGAVMLVTLARMRGASLPLTGPRRGLAVAALALYMIGFSFAYLTLTAGVGALLLFGAVQITMFTGALLRHEQVPARRWIGTLVAFSGLVWLLWPGGQGAPAPGGAALMAAAGAGWGVYSLCGRGAVDPQATTAANFLLAAPLALLVLTFSPAMHGITAQGVGLAVLSGVVTSGLGYSLWSAVLPRIAATVAAVAQLTVPVIAMAGGMLVIGEPPSWRFAAAALLVLGGVGMSLRPVRSR